MSTTTRSLTNLDRVNTLFRLEDYLQFEEGPGGFTVARLRSSYGEATVSLYGGHVLSYTPVGHEPVLWVSKFARYEAGKAIRGGIPVIWPWFGSHKQDAAKPSHGFARNQTWEVHSSRLIDNETPQLRLILQDNAVSHALWPHAFSIELIVTVSDALDVDLVIVNRGDHAFDCSSALHTYLNVSDIHDVAIHGLEGSAYLDQLKGMEIKTQEGPIRFTAETDNIHFDTNATCRLTDTGFNREIEVDKRGSASTVIWNPWIEKAGRMADFGDEEYQTMVCIETANAGPDLITVLPGAAHVLGTTLRAKAHMGA